MRRGRPTKAYLATLRKPSLPDYNKLAVACVEAIIGGGNDVIVSFSYLMQFPEDFPKGILMNRDGEVDMRKIKARKLLTWLNEKGYTAFSVESLKKQREALTKAECSLTENVELWLDENQTIDYDA